MNVLEYAWLIPVFPFIAFIIVGLFGNRMKEGGAPVAIAGAIAAFVLSALVGYETFSEGGVFVQTQEWLVLTDQYTLEVGIYIDNLTALMILFVSLISTLIVVYSIGYMHEEGNRKRRYYAEVSLFITAMLGLVLASNYIEMFIFWEVVGLCSYLLIGFWNHKPSAASAAKKAFLVTRIGDVMLMSGIILLLSTFETLNYTELFGEDILGALTSGQSDKLMLASLLIFGGAIGKSAQFPLHDWLPDAMEGPTTVSALIHAATMVKAGVYLTARSFPLFVQSPDVLLFVAAIGGFTAFYCATMALNNMNIKRVLAYSTLSQLGYMILALGAGGYVIATLDVAASKGFTSGTFHMMNHAFFKALLFLCAGSVIHAVGTEDMRKMGGLSKKMKITSLTMLIAALSISGIPPFSGFWSKDEVLASAWEAADANTAFYLLWFLGVATAFMTAFYMFRLWFMTFTGPEGEASGHAHESPKSMTWPLMILAVFAFGSGLLFLLPNGFDAQLHFAAEGVGDYVIGGHEIETMELLEEIFTEPLTYLSIVVALAGLFLAYLMYYRKSVDPAMFSKGAFTSRYYKVLNKRYGFYDGYNWMALKIGYGFAKVVDFFDRKGIDGFINGIAGFITGGGDVLRRIQTGRVQSYGGYVIAGVSAIVVLIYLLGGVL